MPYKFPLTIMVVVVIVIVIGLFYRTQPDTDALQKVFASGVLRIGYANEAPFASMALTYPMRRVKCGVI